MLPQDLHIHTTFSVTDSSVVPQQTIDLVAAVKHARITGISDHFDCLVEGSFAAYQREIRRAGLKLGTEVDGHAWVDEAVTYDLDYYIIHCRDRSADYRSLERLLATGKPVILAHPNVFETNLKRVPKACLVEINNRYVWRTDWRSYYGPFKNDFKFVIGSDAHQPNWLGQSVARCAAGQLGITEHLLFSE